MLATRINCIPAGITAEQHASDLEKQVRTLEADWRLLKANSDGATGELGEELRYCTQSWTRRT